MAKQQQFDIRPLGEPEFDIKPVEQEAFGIRPVEDSGIKPVEQFDIRPDPLAFLSSPPVEIQEAEFFAPEINQIADPTGIPEDIERGLRGDFDRSDPMGEILSKEVVALGAVGKLIGAPITRINKAVSVNLEPWMRAFTPFEEWGQNVFAHAGNYLLSKSTEDKEFILKEAKALRPDIDWFELKKTPAAMWSGLKALVPWPGMADRTPTFGKIMGDRYTRLTGKPPPFGYMGGMDIAAETVGFGLVTKAAQAARGGTRFAKPLIDTSKLKPAEIQQARKIFVGSRIARMSPQQVRVELAKNAAELQRLGEPALKPVDRLSSLVRIASKSAKEQKALRSAELGKRVAAGERIKGAVSDPRQALKVSVGALKGELPKGVFSPPEANISADDIMTLFGDIKQSRQPFFQQINTAKALEQLLAGEIPQQSGIQLLRKQFGDDLARAIISRRTLGEKAGSAFLDVMNFPRTMLASHDLSFPLRQGGLLLPGHPGQWAKSFGRMIKATGSEKYAKVVDDALDTGKFAELRQRLGVAKLPIDSTLTTSAFREEEFMSAIANKIPTVRISNRAFVTMGNQLRANVFDSVAARWAKQGITFRSDPKSFQDLANFVNSATGRGDLGKLENLSGVLSAVFFAPRLQVSRVQLPIQLVTAAPAARKVIAKDLAIWLGAGVSVMQLAKWGGAETEADLRSSDFGKIVVGNTRFDVWSGNAQLARVMAQVTTGQRKTTGTGKIKTLTNKQRVDVLTRFLRTKLAPPPSLVVDLIKSENVVGEPVDLKTKKGLATEVWKRNAPLVAQEIVDAIRFQGLDGSTPFVVGGSVIGLGVQTWPESITTKAYNLKQRAAMEYAGVDWNQLSPSETQILSQTDPDIAQAMKQATFERTDLSFVGDLAQSQKEHGSDVFDMLDPFIQRRFTENLETMGSLPRTFGTWEMNNERFKAYKQEIARIVNQRHIVNMLKGPQWENRLTRDKQGLLQEIKRAAKERAKFTVMRKAEEESFPRRRTRQ